MKEGIGQRDQPRTRFDNYSGEAVPPYAVLRIDDTAAAQNHALKAYKPNGISTDCTFALNLSRQVAHNASTPKHAGTCTNAYGAWALYDYAGGSDTPAPGEEWGPDDDWLLHKGKSGYRIVGGAEEFTVGATTYRRVRVHKVDAPQITVYEFRNCENTSRRLYLDNTDIADHEAGEVAVIRIDGLIECWQLFGPAPQCKTGSCAEILSWGANCDSCSVCFYLTPCGGGSPTFVRGIEWWQYEGRVVKLDGPGHEGCYTVAEADGCFDVDEALGVEHITDDYANCDGCGCYELENCADSGDVIYVSGDLASVVGAASGAASIGSFVKRRGVCYEITGFANPCGTTPDEWDIDEVEEIASCGGCCYALTNCDDPEDVEYYRLSSTDTVDPADFLNDDGTSNGRVLMLTGYVCRTWSVPEECPESGVTLGLPTILEEFDSCDECVITCWKKCGTSTYIRTYSDMKEVGPNAAVKRAEDGFCYVRETSPGTCGTPSIVIFTIEEIIDEGVNSCTICQTPRVKLTPACGSACSDCAGSSSGGSGSGRTAIVTDNAALFGAVNQYIKNDGACYLVSWTTDALTGTLGCWTGPYNSCGACNDAPSTLTVIALVGGEHKNVKIQGSFNICGESALSECE